jgi:hypothetical protein
MHGCISQPGRRTRANPVHTRVGGVCLDVHKGPAPELGRHLHGMAWLVPFTLRIATGPASANTPPAVAHCTCGPWSARWPDCDVLGGSMPPGPTLPNGPERLRTPKA